MKRKVIVLGDKTTHGGEFIQTSHSLSVAGKKIALVGDKVSCPKCEGDFPIVEGSSVMSYQGKKVALEGMKTACGAELIGSQGMMSVEEKNRSAQQFLFNIIYRQVGA